VDESSIENSIGNDVVCCSILFLAFLSDEDYVEDALMVIGG